MKPMEKPKTESMGQLFDKNEQLSVTDNNIRSIICSIRGRQVILDRDLAVLYQVDVAQMNRQVKRNIERFPDDFMFRLTKTEWDLLKCHFGISKEKGGDRALPNAFTEQGISMLSGLLRSEVAIKINILIMRTFAAMRQFVTANAGLFQRVESLERQQISFDEKIVDILNKIEELNPAPPTEQLFSSGCVWDAWSFLSELIRSAKRRIILIDNFVDERTLSLLDKREDDVQCTVYTRYNAQTNTDFEKHNAQIVVSLDRTNDMNFLFFHASFAGLTQILFFKNLSHSNIICIFVAINCLITKSTIYANNL